MKIRSAWVAWLGALLSVLLMRLLFRTCRVKIVADVDGLNAYQSTGSRRYLFSIWHDQILMTLFSGKPRDMAGLVSQHQDGSYVAEAMRMLGIAQVRGSSKRGGAQAMRQMIEAAADLHIAITPDGPRGPRRQLKQGIVFLASNTGRGIVPAAYTCKRFWSVQANWSDMMIPKPFTTIYVRGGAPFAVPPDLSRDGLAAYTAKVQAEMDRLEAEVQVLARGGTLERPALKAAA